VLSVVFTILKTTESTERTERGYSAYHCFFLRGLNYYDKFIHVLTGGDMEEQSWLSS
jgi:hypothetical protein